MLYSHMYQYQVEGDILLILYTVVSLRTWSHPLVNGGHGLSLRRGGDR